MHFWEADGFSSATPQVAKVEPEAGRSDFFKVFKNVSEMFSAAWWCSAQTALLTWINTNKPFHNNAPKEPFS